MNVSKAIEKRASIRAFLDRDIDRTIVEEILSTARWAASGTNTQPWEIAVVSGNSKNQLCDALVTAFDDKVKANPDYQYYPIKWEEPYKSRRFQCGMALYQALDIERNDTENRHQQWRLNYQAFHAPVILFCFIDKTLEKGSWLDYGMFIQNIMLAALDHDLATCPQAALAEYPDIVREHLGERYQAKDLICGIALGYPDTEAKVNNYRTQREDVSVFTQYFE